MSGGRQDHRHPAAGQFIITDDDSGETAAAGAERFSDMLRNFDLTEDLYELMWQGANLEQPAAVSSHRLSPAPPPPPPVVPAAETTSLPAPPHHHTLPAPPHHHSAPPSEEQMAAWLYPIVSGDFSGRQPPPLAHQTAADDPRPAALPPEKKTRFEPWTLQMPMTAHRPTEITTQTKDTASDDSGGKKKAASSVGARSHHSPGAHNLTEKRRRLKITERLKTLQQLVPGCHNSNQASTLEQTIQYMKSLQDQVKAMYAAAVHPLHQYMTPPTTTRPPEAGGVTMPMPPRMVPLGAMLPFSPHYPVPAVWLPPAAAAPSVASAAASGSHRRHASSSGGRSKSSSLQLCRQKQ